MEITVKELLQQLSLQFQSHSETAVLDAQVLLAHHLEKPRTWILAHPEALVTDAQHKKILQSATRLEHGVPLPYVIGHWEFYGMDFILTPDVLIPRPETELLVETAIKWLQLHPQKRNAVDVGTGSGCIGIAIAKHIPDLLMVLTDLSSEALTVARLNVEKHRLQDRLEIRQSDLLERFPALFTFDLICANLPYIPSSVLDTLSIAKSEPLPALDGGESGLIVIKRLLKQAESRLSPGGLMLLEIDPAQRDQMIQLTQKHFPSTKVQILNDLSGKDRCVTIELPFMIYHLCQRQEWMNSQKQGEFRDTSLVQDGFIHCSQYDQVTEVANRYYKGVPDMVVLCLEPGKLISEIRWEKVGSEYYPHIYGPINLEAVNKIIAIEPISDGTYPAIPGLLY